MLKIGDRLDSYTLAAGEPWIMSVQMRSMIGNTVLNWSQRRLVLSFYDVDRTKLDQIDGVYSSDASGAFFAFIRDGRFSEGLYGKAVQVELAERLQDGRSVIATGALSVVPSSLGVTTYGAIIGRVDARFSLYFNTAGLILLIEQELLPYSATSVPPPPTVQTPAAINSDGTPQVGEQLTGVDPVFQYASITRRRWLNGTTALATTSLYTPNATGALTWSVDGLGEDGSPIKSESTITVATATPTPSFTANPSFSGTPKVGQPVSALAFTEGLVANGSVTSRAYLLAGSGVALSYVFQVADVGKAFVFLNTATGGITASSAPSNVAAAGAAAPTPQNAEVIGYSDSRWESHTGNAVVNSSGFAPTLYNRGIGSHIGPRSGNKLRLGRNHNFAIGGGSAQQAAANPRLAVDNTETPGNWWRGTATTSGSNNKGFVQAGQHPAGIVVVQIEANGFVAGTGAGSTYASILTIINGILAQDPNKVIILSNGLPRGVNNAGGFQNDLGTGASALEYAVTAANLMKLSFDSGNAAAMPRVIAVDTMAVSRDPAETNAVRNLRGYQVDGLHPSYFGAVKETDAIIARIQAVLPSWYAALPTLVPAPTSTGLTSQGKAVGDAQPFLNRNPNMTAGGNGAVSGTYGGTAPTAAQIPEGYTLIGTATGSATVAVDKTTTPNETRVQVGGVATAVTTLFEFRSTVSGADLTTLTGAGLFSLSDRLRLMLRASIAAGSVNLTGVYGKLTIFGDTTNKNRVAIVGASSALAKINDFLDGGDGTFRTIQSDVLDLAEPNMAVTPGALTNVSSMLVSIFLEFSSAIGDPLAADVRLTQHGVFRSAS